MTCQRTRCRWRWCPGCGRERRLARDGAVLCQHNRWDPVARAMVPCKGSGQQPVPGGTTDDAGSAPGGAGGIGPAAGQPDPAARRGAA